MTGGVQLGRTVIMNERAVVGAEPGGMANAAGEAPLAVHHVAALCPRHARGALAPGEAGVVSEDLARGLGRQVGSDQVMPVF
jgi:hypothetical protein